MTKIDIAGNLRGIQVDLGVNVSLTVSGSATSVTCGGVLVTVSLLCG